MKEATKDKKAVEFFNGLVAKAKANGNYNEIDETVITIAGNEYKAVVDTFNLLITVYQIIDECNSIEIATI